MNKYWKCPNCEKIVTGYKCSCGYEKKRSDKYIDEYSQANNTYVNNQNKNYSGKKAAVVAVVAVVIFGIVGLLSQSGNNNSGSGSYGSGNYSSSSRNSSNSSGNSGSSSGNGNSGNSSNSKNESSYAAAQCDGQMIVSVIGYYVGYMDRVDNTSNYTFDVKNNNDMITYTIIAHSKNFGDRTLCTVKFSAAKNGDYYVSDGKSTWEDMLQIYKYKL